MKRTLLIIGVIFNLFIWFNSFLPANVSSNQSNFIVNIFYPLFKNIFKIETFSLIIRKLAHFSEYMILSLLFVNIYKSFNIKLHYLITVIHGLLTAIVDELIQLSTIGRSGEIRDVLIDLSGVLFGLLVFYVYKTKKNKKEAGE